MLGIVAVFQQQRENVMRLLFQARNFFFQSNPIALYSSLKRITFGCCEWLIKKFILPMTGFEPAIPACLNVCETQ